MTDSREEFEKHIDDCIVSEVGFKQALEKDVDGEYTTPWVNSKWQAWRAAREALLTELRNDAERWRWLVRHASLGFDGAPSWRAVEHGFEDSKP